MYLNIKNIFLFFVLFIIYVVNCVPTSVLINSKEIGAGLKQTNKVKRAPLNENIIKDDKVIDDKTKDINNINNEGSNFVDHDVIDEKEKFIPKKRGVNNQYYNDGSDLIGNLPYGFWEDNYNANMYPDLQDLQGEPSSVINSDQLFNELMPLPMELSSPSYYADKRRKRSNKKMNKKLSLKHPMSLRLKRDSKLTPADMLALVALVEAGERARIDPELYENGYGGGIELPTNTVDYLQGPKSMLPYDMMMPGVSNQNIDDLNGDWSNSWVEPSVEYMPYGMPFDMDTNPRYEMYKDRTLNRLNKVGYPSKRFMVAKKKRSLNVGNPTIGHMNKNNDLRFGQERFYSEPVIPGALQTPNYDYDRYSLNDLMDNIPRNYHNRYY